MNIFSIIVIVILLIPFFLIVKLSVESNSINTPKKRDNDPDDLPPIPTDILLKQRAELKNTPVDVLDFAKKTRRSVQTRYFTVWFYDDTRKWEITATKDRSGNFRGGIGRYIGYKFSYDDVSGLEVQMEDLGEKISTFSLVSRTLVGNALMGDTGAVVGGLTAKENQYVREVNFVVFQCRRSMPEIVLPLCIGECKTSSTTYKNALASAKSLEEAFRLMNAKD